MQTLNVLQIMLISFALCEGKHLDAEPLTITLANQRLSSTLEGASGSLIIRLADGRNTSFRNCQNSQTQMHCFENTDTGAGVTIKNVDTGYSTISCHEVTWHNPDSKQEDCILLGNAFWYGGSEMKLQHWPIQATNLSRIPYVTGDFGHNPLGGILDSLWFNSEGYFIFVDRSTPLFIRFNETGNEKLCLSSSYDEYPFNGASSAARSHKELKYTFCTSDNVREAFQYASGRWMSKPTDVIDPSVVTWPIWSTWARYFANINQDIVLKFATEISANGFKGSHLEIDDKWEVCYGELEFDTNKFPNTSGLVSQIKKLGFNVSLWIHPYTNTDCGPFSDPEVRNFLIKREDTGEPLECTWWNGVGGYLDTTNPAARNYFVSKVTHIRDTYGIDSFKFDSGEVDYISKGFRLNDSNIMATPNEFTRMYVDTAARLGNAVEVRVAYNAQNLPIFIRMLDKDSRWDYENGLQSLIPTALHMSIIGYPFILPDMIGGNNYGSKDLPEKELFIRWLQVNALMPVLQFSITPWDYDQEVVNISKAMVELHEQYAPVINQLALEAVQTGNPIVRPLWWMAPKDVEAQGAEQQFLLGDDILVAPVVEKGATSRDIYFIEGKWEDQNEPNQTYTGPLLLKNYKAQLHQLPYFKRKG